MVGILLAGGTGSRLYPLTVSTSKQLLPIYNKPLIFYSLSILMLTGINKIAIITSPDDKESYQKLLGDGKELGCDFQYLVQKTPKGIAEAFIIAEEFIGINDVALVLGDNFLYGNGLSNILKNNTNFSGAKIFGVEVQNPQEYGVINFNRDGTIKSLEEKPLQPKSKMAIPGVYFYKSSVVSVAKSIHPSSRGELEITSINQHYLMNKSLSCDILPRGITWLDTGNHENLYKASEFVRVIEKNSNRKIACLEEIAFKNGYINIDGLKSRYNKYKNSDYGNYLKYIIDENR